MTAPRRTCGRCRRRTALLAWIDDVSILARTRDRVPSAELRAHLQGHLDVARAMYARLAREAE